MFNLPNHSDNDLLSSETITAVNASDELPPSKPSSRNSVIIALLGLIFVLATTPLAVYMVGQRQDIRKEAEETATPTPCPEYSIPSDEETHVMTYQPNPDTTFNRFVLKAHDFNNDMWGKLELCPVSQPGDCQLLVPSNLDDGRDPDEDDPNTDPEGFFNIRTYDHDHCTAADDSPFPPNYPVNDQDCYIDHTFDFDLCLDSNLYFMRLTLKNQQDYDHAFICPKWEYCAVLTPTPTPTLAPIECESGLPPAYTDVGQYFYHNSEITLSNPQPNSKLDYIILDAHDHTTDYDALVTFNPQGVNYQEDIKSQPDLENYCGEHNPNIYPNHPHVDSDFSCYKSTDPFRLGTCDLVESVKLKFLNLDDPVNIPQPHAHLRRVAWCYCETPTATCQDLVKSPVNPGLGDAVTLTCTSSDNTAADHFNFRYQINQGQYVYVNNVAPKANQPHVAETIININQEGNWHAQCQVCPDQTNDLCTNWGAAQ